MFSRSAWAIKPARNLRQNERLVNPLWSPYRSAMAAPVTPAQFLASIPSVGDDMCTRIKKSLIDGPTDFYELVNWMFNSDGTISTAFAESLCTELQALGCVSGGGVTSSTTSGGAVPDAVSDLEVSDGYGSSGVYGRFTPPAGATGYDLYRSETNDFATARRLVSNYLIGQAACPDVPASLSYDPNVSMADSQDFVTFFDDCSQPAGGYPLVGPYDTLYYWVVARNASGASGVSNGGVAAVGRQVMISPFIGVSSGNALVGFPYTVPGGVTKLRITVRGNRSSGAGGGNSYGGGGAGGVVVASAVYNVAGGEIVSVEGLEAATEGAFESNGTTAADVVAKIDGVEVIRVSATAAGVYNPAGGGTGGPGGDSGNVTFSSGSNQTVWDGRAGANASGAIGGCGGTSYWEAKPGCNHYCLPPTVSCFFPGFGVGPGGGSCADGGDPLIDDAWITGGPGTSGSVKLIVG